MVTTQLMRSSPSEVAPRSSRCRRTAGPQPTEELAPDFAEAVGDAESNGGEGAAPPPPPADPNQLIPPEQAYLVTDMLRAVVLEGTGTRARSLGRPVAGKTGTTNDQADAWFVGFSPEVAAGVWVGYDQPQSLNGPAVKDLEPVGELTRG